MPFQPRSSTKYLMVATAIWRYHIRKSAMTPLRMEELTPSIAGCLEKNRILPVGARAISHILRILSILRHLKSGHIVNCQWKSLLSNSKLNLKKANEDTHVDINKSTSKIKSSGEARNNFQATIPLLASFLG